MERRWTSEYSGYQKYWSVFEVPDAWWKPAAERRAREPAKPNSFEKLKSFAGGVRARVFGGAATEAPTVERKAVLVFFDYEAAGDTGQSGHIPETLELARALVKQGHTVHYFAQETARAVVAATGANFQPYDHTAQVQLANDRDSKLRHADSVANFKLDEAALAQVKEQGLRASGADQDNQSLSRSHALLPAAVYLLGTGQLLEQVQKLAPECIVCDSCLPWGRLVADILNIPLVASSSSNYVSLGASVEAEATKIAEIDYVQQCVKTLKDKYGVEYDPTQINHNYSEFTIVWTVPEFEPEAAKLMSQGVHFYGASFPPMSSRLEGGDSVTVVLGEALHGFPFAKLRSRKTAGEKVIFCLIDNNSAEISTKICETIVAAFGEQENVTVVLASQHQPAELPNNFLGCQECPQKTLLTLADVFVCHMDSTSVNESAYIGVPMVGLPMTKEQQFNADRAVALSLGTSVAPDSDGQINADALTNAITEVDCEATKKGCSEMKKMMLDYHEYLMTDAAKDILAYIEMHGR